MDRRAFVLALAGLLTPTCTCMHLARAGIPHGAQGCRTATAGDNPSTLGLSKSAPTPDDESLRGAFAEEIGQLFGVRPAVCFYDDRDSPNAFATPQVIFPEGPDGTVALGRTLLAKDRAK